MNPLIHLSKTISHALRHEPWVYELELDGEGWVPVAALLNALRETDKRFGEVSLAQIREIMVTADKQRFELRGAAGLEEIRALYGHSLPGKLARTAAEPPILLYHGTASATVEVIMQGGLMPMSRQYVHLSVDRETALQVGRRKDGKPALFIVDAARAHRAGVRFYRGNDKVWLADGVPAIFLAVAAG